MKMDRIIYSERGVKCTAHRQGRVRKYLSIDAARAALIRRRRRHRARDGPEGSGSV